jgi:hypothetical protein
VNSVEIELWKVGIIAPISLVWFEDNPPATRFGMYPREATASDMRARVAGATESGRLSARETVIGATPANRATSRIPTRLVCRVFFLFSFSADIRKAFPRYTKISDRLDSEI